MSGATPPLPQYAFTAWCSVKAQGQLYLLPLPANEVRTWDILHRCESTGSTALCLLMHAREEGGSITTKYIPMSPCGQWEPRCLIYSMPWHIKWTSVDRCSPRRARPNVGFGFLNFIAGAFVLFFKINERCIYAVRIYTIIQHRRPKIDWLIDWRRIRCLIKYHAMNMYPLLKYDAMKTCPLPKYHAIKTSIA